MTDASVYSPDWTLADLEPFIEVSLEAFGPGRVVFGSDWPVCLLRADYPEVAALVRDWTSRLSAAEQAQLWGGTAMRCYGLQP